MPLTILYHDADYIAIDKPPGLLVHRTELAAEATEFAVQTLSAQIGQPVFPCHRLDRPTSGVLLFALQPEALVQAQRAFMNKTCTKKYLAVCRGWVSECGIIDSPLRSETNPSKIRDAITHFRTISQIELAYPSGRYSTSRLSLVELTPETGRTHQLRRHLAHIRHPILGDTRHGDGAQNKLLRILCGESQGLLLRAVSLKIQFPANKVALHISAPETLEWRHSLTKLKLHSNIPQ